jgi:chlorobactene glucosyltransferase
MMIILLYIALGYLLITSGILYLNQSDFNPLEPTPRNYFDHQAPEVSICIPARNEADSIERCIRSAIDQQYPNHHVYVLNDGSTDDTTEILEQLSNSFPNKLTVIPGKSKPKDWIGKTWACHQLSEEASGEIIVFIDADTWLEPEATAKFVRSMGRDVVDLVTVWPEQKLGTFWEKIVIPLVYFALLTLLPIRYVHRNPKWLPSFLKNKMSPLFAAACGQFMAFKRKTYQSIGGHASVKDNVVEDVALAKKIKRSGFRMKMYHGLGIIYCRMYSSAEELWSGFRKNFLAGFGNNIYLFIAMGLLHIIVFILPIIFLPFLITYGSGITLTLCTAVILFMLLQRFFIDRWFKWSLLYSLLHPLGVFWFQILGIRVILDRFNEKSAEWKGRTL